MIIKQLSVRIEDRAGGAWQVFQTLADNGINILSYSVNDTTDTHGELRLIVDSVRRADEVLTAAGFTASLTDVYSLNVPNETGSMSTVLRLLSDAGVSLQFLYAFQYRGISQAIVRADDMEQLRRVLEDYERHQLGL